MCQCCRNPLKLWIQETRRFSILESLHHLLQTVKDLFFVTGTLSYSSSQSCSHLDMAIQKLLPLLFLHMRSLESRQPENSNQTDASVRCQFLRSASFLPVPLPVILPSEISLFSSAALLSCVLWDWTISTPERWAGRRNTESKNLH